MLTFISTILLYTFHFPVFLSLLLFPIDLCYIGCGFCPLYEFASCILIFVLVVTLFRKKKNSFIEINSQAIKITNFRNIIQRLSIKESYNHHNNLNLAHFYHFIRNTVPFTSHIPSLRCPNPY